MGKLQFFVFVLLLSKSVFASEEALNQLNIAIYNGDIDRAAKALKSLKSEDLCEERDDGSLFQMAYENRNFEVAFLILNYISDEDLGSVIKCDGELERGFLRDIIKYGSKRVIKFVMSKQEYSNGVELESGVMRQDLDILKLLLGFDELRSSSYLSKTLYVAGIYGFKKGVVELLMAGAKVSSPRNDSAVLAAFKSGHLDLANFLLECIGEQLKVKHLGDLLVVSVYDGDLESVNWLLGKGANPDSIAAFDFSRIEYVDMGIIRIISTLSSKARNNFQITPLMAASRKGQFETVKLLLSHGADVDKEIRYMTALKYALLEGHNAVIKELLEAGANVNGASGYKSAMMMVVESGNVEAIRILVKYGVDVNKVFGGRTALMAAAEGGDENGLVALIDANADVNKMVDGNCALTAAVRAGCFQCVRVLIENGADLNLSPFVYGGSLLYRAIKKGNYEIIKYLIESGVDVNVGYFSITPIEIATDLGCHNVVELLKKHGAII